MLEPALLERILEAISPKTNNFLFLHSYQLFHHHRKGETPNLTEKHFFSSGLARVSSVRLTYLLLAHNTANGPLERHPEGNRKRSCNGVR